MLDKKYSVYKCTNTINGYAYIGITSMGVQDRIYAHMYEAYHDMNNHSAFKEALRYYGADSFKVEVLNSGISAEEAIRLEKYYILSYKTYINLTDCKGYNSSLGGEGVHEVYSECNYINQYKASGEFVATYSSLRHAEVITGITRVGIANACDGKAISCGGYQWRRYKDVGYSTDDIPENVCGMDRVIKKVNQYNLDGIYIKTFDSIESAAEELGIYGSTIVKVCKGELNQTHGYMWRYADEVAIGNNIVKYNDEHKTIRRKVTQLDLSGTKLAEYDSIAEAAYCTGLSTGGISSVLNKDRKLGGYYWKSETEYKHTRKIGKFDLNNNLIETYESMMQAATESKIARSSIYKCCAGKCKQSGGYIWRYID